MMEASRSAPSRPPPAYDEAAVYPSAFPAVPTHRVVPRTGADTVEVSYQRGAADSLSVPRDAVGASDDAPPVHAAAEATGAASNAELESLVDMGIDPAWAALALKRCDQNLSDAAMFCLENLEQKDSMLLEESIALRRRLAVDAAAAVSSPRRPAADDRTQPKSSTRFKNIFPWMKRSKSRVSTELVDEPSAAAHPLDPLYTSAPLLSVPMDAAGHTSEDDPHSEIVVNDGDTSEVTREFLFPVTAAVRAADSDDEEVDGLFDTTSSITVMIPHDLYTDPIDAAPEVIFCTELTVPTGDSNEQAIHAADEPDLLSWHLPSVTPVEAIAGSASIYTDSGSLDGAAADASAPPSAGEDNISVTLDNMIVDADTVPADTVPAGDDDIDPEMRHEVDDIDPEMRHEVLLSLETEHSCIALELVAADCGGSIEQANIITLDNSNARAEDDRVTLSAAIGSGFLAATIAEFIPSVSEQENAAGPDFSECNPAVVEAALEGNSTVLINDNAPLESLETSSHDEAIFETTEQTLFTDPFDSTSLSFHLPSWDDTMGITPTDTGTNESNSFIASAPLPVSEEMVVENILMTVRPPVNSLPRAMTVEDGFRMYRIEGSDVLTADAVEGQRDSEVEYIPLVDAMVSIGETTNVPPEVMGAYVSDGTQLYMTIAAPIGVGEDSHTPSVMAEQISVHFNSQPRGLRQIMFGSERDTQHRTRPIEIPRRQLLDASLVPDSENPLVIKNIILTLQQPKLAPGKKTPQGHRPNRVALKFKHLTIAQARSLAEANAPPIWSGGNDPLECTLCQRSHGVFRPLHHCRNCGYYVCDNCSDKYWPSSMLPECYHHNESFVRTCDSCNVLMESFNDALRRGDCQAAFAAYSSGNVNLHCPLTVYKSEEYPIHCAVRGGNLMLVKWLMETKHVAVSRISASGVNVPFLTTKGVSCLGIAAYYGHADIMKYLVQKQGCSLMEITDTDVLRRGLHATLEAPGPLPLVAGKPAWFQKKAIPHKDASDEELSVSLSPAAPTPTTPVGRTPVVRGHLVTGNPRYQDAIVAVSANVPLGPSPQLSMPTTYRPKQQHFRHKPVSNVVLQRTLQALQNLSSSNRVVFHPTRRYSAPNLLEAPITTGNVPSRLASTPRPVISPVGHFDRAQSSEPLFAVGNVTQRSADDIEIDYSLPDQDVMRMIIMALTQGDVEEEAPQPSPQQRIRNITDAYIVPYNDDDVISMSTPRR